MPMWCSCRCVQRKQVSSSSSSNNDLGHLHDAHTLAQQMGLPKDHWSDGCSSRQHLLVRGREQACGGWPITSTLHLAPVELR